MKASICVDDFDANIEDWIKIREKTRHQPSGIESNRRDVGILSRYLHDQKIAEITGEVILDFITCLCDVRHNAAAAVNRKMSSIKSYLRHLHFRQIEGAAKFPIEYLPRAREPYSGPIQALEPQEVKKLLGCIDKNSVLGFRDFLLYSLLYRLGLRIGEALSINLKDIDLKKQILTIHGKGRRKRKLPLVSDIPALIEKWLLLRQMLCGAKDSDALFISKKGNCLAQRTAQENFQKIVGKAGPLTLDKVTPHSLRHAFASHAIDGEADLIVLKAVLGHASLQSTERYVHPSMRVLQKAVNEHISSQILSELIEENVVVLRVQQQRSCAACGG
jgi:site-specific recombinase XerD